MITEHTKYILTDAINNNNKFWEYEINDDASLTYRWGRVGTTGQSKSESTFSRSSLNKKISEKTSKGYVKVDIVASKNSVTPVSKEALSKTIIKQAVTEQFCQDQSDPILMALVNRLVDTNRHEIVKSTGGMMNVDISTGIISTALGVVSKDSIITAKDLLDGMTPFVIGKDLDNPDYLKLLNKYMMKIPQKVGSSRGWHKYFLSDATSLQKQSTLLDQLEASVDLAVSRIANAPATSAADHPKPIFDVKLNICTDKDVIKMITDKFNSTLQQQHVSARLKPLRIFEVEIPEMKKAYDADGAKLSKQELLWHGTRVFNVLSILKNGLIIPPTRGGTYQIAGRMFGNGIYTAISSSKSLNYSFGYWDGGPRDNNCFMFLCDVAMGNYYTPKSSSESLPKAGYDSTWAIPGKSGIQNDEIIVYRTSQCNIRYLIEFGE